MLSSVKPARRERALADYDFGDTKLTHIEGDLANPAFIDRQRWDAYDGVVFVASDRLRSGAQSDARTILGFLLVREVLEERSLCPRIVVELLDASNRSLVRGADVEVIVSPKIIGRILSHVTLRPELRAVYEEMLDAEGSVLALRSIAHYGIDCGPARFEQLHVTVRAAGDRLLGVMPGIDDLPLALNPDVTTSFSLDDATRLVVLTG
jgi:hypothetical protein